MIISSGITNQILYLQVQKFIIEMRKKIKSAMVKNTALKFKVFVDVPCFILLDQQQLWICIFSQTWSTLS